MQDGYAGFGPVGVGLLLALMPFFARPQGGPPMISDDPGTPGDGHWEINVATLSFRTVDTDAIQVPLIDLNYGLGDRIQLKYEVPWVVEHSGDDVRAGLGGSLLGVKWRFFDGGASGWQVSTYPQVEFNYPASSSPRRGLSDSGTNTLIPLEFERSYGHFDVDLEFGGWRRAAAGRDSWIAGVVVGSEWRKGIELIGELHDETLTGSSRSELIANFGARWDLSGRFTIMIAVGRDLENRIGPSNLLLTYVGLQTRL
jgi:hypothetical protein